MSELAPEPTRPGSDWDDPIVAEVRAVREALAAEDGYDLDRMYVRLKALEEAERAAGRVILPPPARARRPDAAA